MSALASSLISSASRPLRLQLRGDLTMREQQYQGRRCWVVKDPLSLKYYRFEEEEHALLTWLDGEQSLQSLQKRFEREFAPQKITLQEIHQFVGAMHQASLVVSDAIGQGHRLLERRREQASKRWMGAFANLLCVRFKGFDPDRLLTWLNARIGWIFSGPAVALGLLIALAAGVLILVEFDVFRSRLPAFHEFFAAQNWLWLAAMLALTKVLHEFGHGLTCKRFGGECHEMGVMLLVLTPCLYCNVSDSWMLPSKWKRAAIGAAGMYVEIVLASICTLIWWNTRPGMLNYLCLNVMFVSSVSTIIFNANPLLRYDGYYILSDLLEIPNLRKKASSILLRRSASFCLGLPEADDPFLPARRRWLFAAYSIAAVCYRWVVVFSIIWFLNSVLEPYGLKPLGQALAVVSLYGLAVHPLWQFGKFITAPGRWDQVSKVRFAATVAVAASLIGAVLFAPTPHYVRCHVHIRPRNAAPVYVETPGVLASVHARPGKTLQAGAPIVSLTNTSIDVAMTRLAGRRNELQVRAATNNNLALLGMDEAALEMEELEKAIQNVERQMSEQQGDKDRLRICAPANGELIAAPHRRKRESEVHLASWSGQPTAPQNVGASYSYGDLIGYVGDPRKLEAILLIDQDDVEFVAAGQPVSVVFDQQPGRRVRAAVDHLAKRPARGIPGSMAGRNGGPIPSQRGPEGREKPLEAYYEAAVSIDDPQGSLAIGGLGMARIRVGTRTIGQRLLRYVQQLSY